MALINEIQYAQRWLRIDTDSRGLQLLGLYAAIGDFMSKSAAAEAVTRKIARDLLSASGMRFKFKGQKILYRDAPLGYFEDSAQAVGRMYQRPQATYGGLLEVSQNVLESLMSLGERESEARDYLLGRLRDAGKTRLYRNSLAHSPVMWFSRHPFPAILDRRFSVEKNIEGEDVIALKPDLPMLSFDNLLRMSVLADALCNAEGLLATVRIWPESFPDWIYGGNETLCWPPEDLYAGIEFHPGIDEESTE